MMLATARMAGAARTAGARAARALATCVKKEDVLQKWDSSKVAKWAKDDVGISENAAKILEKQEIDGESLVDMTVPSLIHAGVLAGPASKLIRAVRKLVSPEPKPEPKPKTVRFSDIGAGGSTTFKSQTDFEEFLSNQGAAGVRNGDDIIVLEFDELKDNQVYTVEFATGEPRRRGPSS
eukprot:m.151022 g.151022  ORF g.151022 m.151022 type:complete len:179 (+) comp11693_c0_seq2:45-581(+)